VKAALLAHGAAVARLVLAIRDAEQQGAEGVTYAWAAQQLDVDRKAVKRTAHRAERAKLLTIAAESQGRGAKARLSLTDEGRTCAE
jgi:hypothetical protein